MPIATAERAHHAAVEAGERAHAADALVVLGTARLHGGDGAGAAQAVDEARGIYAELADPYGLARAAELEYTVAIGMGDLPRARQALDDGALHADRAGVTRLVRQFNEKRTELGT